MSSMRCRPLIVVPRNVNTSASEHHQVEAPLAIVSRLKTLRQGSRHSSAATMCSRDMVMKPIVVATARPYRRSAHDTTISVPMAMSRPANAEAGTECRRDDRHRRATGPALHQPGRRSVEAEPEGQQHVDGEVDPQDLQRRSGAPLAIVKMPAPTNVRMNPASMIICTRMYFIRLS